MAKGPVLHKVNFQPCIVLTKSYFFLQPYHWWTFHVCMWGAVKLWQQSLYGLLNQSRLVVSPWEMLHPAIYAGHMHIEILHLQLISLMCRSRFSPRLMTSLKFIIIESKFPWLPVFCHHEWIMGLHTAVKISCKMQTWSFKVILEFHVHWGGKHRVDDEFLF